MARDSWVDDGGSRDTSEGSGVLPHLLPRRTRPSRHHTVPTGTRRVLRSDTCKRTDEGRPWSYRGSVTGPPPSPDGT